MIPEILKTNEEARKMIHELRGTNYQMKKGIRTGNRVLHKLDNPIEILSSANPF